MVPGNTLCTRRYGKLQLVKLVCVAEPGNSHDRKVMAVEKDVKVIGHLPQKVVRL